MINRRRISIFPFLSFVIYDAPSFPVLRLNRVLLQPPDYSQIGRKKHRPPQKLGRNPGPSRPRRYYNKGGKCH